MNFTSLSADMKADMQNVKSIVVGLHGLNFLLSCILYAFKGKKSNHSI